MLLHLVCSALVGFKQNWEKRRIRVFGKSKENTNSHLHPLPLRFDGPRGDPFFGGSLLTVKTKSTAITKSSPSSGFSPENVQPDTAIQKQLLRKTGENASTKAGDRKTALTA